MSSATDSPKGVYMWKRVKRRIKTRAFSRLAYIFYRVWPMDTCSINTPVISVFYKIGQWDIMIAWLIELLHHFQQFFNHIMAASSPTCVFYLSHSSTPHILSKQLASFSHRLLSHWWKTNDAGHNDFCQTTERMFTKLWFKLTTAQVTSLPTEIYRGSA